MMRSIILAGLGLSVFISPTIAHAVEDVATTPASYNGTAPTAADIANWTSGWAQPTGQPNGFTATTGWNYVGSANGNSAVYLGNGWVLTAAHVGAGDLNLGGVTYPMVPKSAKAIGTVDLLLFQVSPAPALPSLVIRATDPKVGACHVAMLGWGHVDGNRWMTWGYNTVTNVNEPLPLTNNGTAYSSTDFFTLTQSGSGNNYQVVEGDSGGAAFIYNGTSKVWELAGINEASASNDGAAPFYSAFVQLDVYQKQIAAIVMPVADTPALPPWAMGVLASSLACVAAPVCTLRRRS